MLLLEVRENLRRVSKMTEIYEIAILGRVTWQLHSLNNEGAVGNVTEPRSVRIIDPNTKKAVTTDGISGEMLKHIHTEILWAINDKNNNLCEACKVLNPEKFNFVVRGKPSADKVIEDALKKCDICDVHGFLTEVPVSRKSTIEFGWALGIPEIYRDIHTHARHSISARGVEEEKNAGEWGDKKCSAARCETNPNESKLFRIGNKWYCEEHLPVVQMVYHRPTRSGVYAIISVFQPWRIGLNEARQSSYTYDSSDDVRERRYKLVLKAYQLLFARPEGAMTTTRLPHVEDFNGTIIYSTKPMPVPVISPLKNDYINEIKAIVGSIDDSLHVVEFNSIADFAAKMGQLMNNKPYKMML
jgi:CRISPR-associated protein Cst2